MLSLIVVLHCFGSGHGDCALRFVSKTIPANSYKQELVVLYVGTERPELNFLRSSGNDPGGLTSNKYHPKSI
jgi:hypothetical protein